MKTSSPKKLYKVSDVAKILLVTPMHVYRLVYAGKLIAIKRKRMVRIAEDDLLEFYRSCGTRPLRNAKKLMGEIEGMN
jgi:excisionase family DNA binding protein